MGVKSLQEIQAGKKAAGAGVPSLAEIRKRKRAGIPPLAEIQDRKRSEIDAGTLDPFLGRPFPYRLGPSPGPSPRGLFLDDAGREIFQQTMDPMYFGTATGMHFERDAADKLKAMYSVDLNLPGAFVDRHAADITEALLGEKLDPKTAGDRISDAWRNGQLQVQRSDLALQVLMGTDTPATWTELEKLKGALSSDVRAQFRPLWEKMLTSTAEIAPYSVEGIKAAPVGAGAGALAGATAAVVGGNLGPQALVPEESVTVPALVFGGIKLGGGLAAAHRIGQLETGGALLDLLDMGIDPKIAKAAAVGVGVLNAALEMTEISVLLRTLPGGKKLAGRTISGVVNKMLKEHTLRNLATKQAAQFGTYLTVETAQELAQESVNITAEKLGAILHEQFHHHEIETQTIEEIVARYKEVGIKSLQGFTVLGLPGTAASVAVGLGETIVMSGSPAARMRPHVRPTDVKVPDPADDPVPTIDLRKRTPAAVTEAEALAAPALEAAKPQAETKPGQTTAKSGTMAGVTDEKGVGREQPSPNPERPGETISVDRAVRPDGYITPDFVNAITSHYELDPAQQFYAKLHTAIGGKSQYLSIMSNETGEPDVVVRLSDHAYGQGFAPRPDRKPNFDIDVTRWTREQVLSDIIAVVNEHTSDYDLPSFNPTAGQESPGTQSPPAPAAAKSGMAEPTVTREDRSIDGVAYLLADGTVLRAPGAASHVALAQQAIDSGQQIQDAGFIDADGNYIMRDEAINSQDTYSLVAPDGTVNQVMIVDDDQLPEIMTDGVLVRKQDGQTLVIEREQLLAPVEEQFARMHERWERAKEWSTHPEYGSKKPFSEPEPVLSPEQTQASGQEAPGTQSPPAPAASERGTPRGPSRTIDEALNDLSLESLTDKARQIGLTVKGKKAQIAALVAEAIRTKVASKTTRAERKALAETEAAIAAHPIYGEAAEASEQFIGTKIDPTRTYYMDPRMKSEVEGYIGKKFGGKYNAAVGNLITFDTVETQAGPRPAAESWDVAAQEQGFDYSFDEFMDSLIQAVADRRSAEQSGLNDAALNEALRSDEPELLMLSAKRDYLKEGRSTWEINQLLHGLAADAELELMDYEHLLIGGDMAAAPGEAHPGSLKFQEFFDRLGRELIDEASPWMKRWTIGVAEKPREMWTRLKGEWNSIRAHAIASELDLQAVADAATVLTAEQEAELGKIDAQKVAEQILKKHKDTLIGKLVGSMFDDAVEIKQLRAALVQAYKAGTREGISEARTAYQAAQQKVKARRELREYVGKLLRFIKKPVGKSVAFSQRMAIELVQRQIDPKFRRLDTIEKRRASREYFAKHPEAEAPKKTMALIESIAPNELTVAQLETIAKEVRELKRKGRIIRTAAYEAQAAERAADRERIAAAIAGGDLVASPLEPVVKAPVVPMGQKLIDAHRLWLTPERVLDWFDGRSLFHGPVLDLFWHKVYDAEAAKTVRIDEQMAAHAAALESVGMTVADLQAEAMTIAGQPITVQALLGIYNFGKNFFSRMAITYGNFHGALSAERWAAVNQAVEGDPRLQFLADYMMQSYEDHYARLREQVIAVESRDPGKEDNYTPMRRMEANYTPDERNLLSEMMQRDHYKRGYEEKGMTYARQDIKEEHQKPIRLDAWQLLLEQSERREHYIAFAALTKRMRALVNDDGVKAALESKHGAESWNWLRKYTDVVANPNIYRQYNQIERFCGAMRRHTTIAYLSWKLSTALKQMVSMVLGLPEAGVHLLSAGFETATQWQQTREFCLARDPLLGKATLSRELEELNLADPAKHAQFIQRFGQAGLKGLEWFDAPARTIVWYGTYQHQLAAAVGEGLDPAAAEDRAVKAARLTVSRTQPGARVFQIPEAYRTNEVLNLFQQFTNQLNKLWNMGSYDIAMLAKNKQYSRAAMTFAALGLQAGLIWAITKRRLPEDEEDFASIASEQFIGLIPAAGSNIIAYLRGFGGGEIAATEGAAEFVVNMSKAAGDLAAGEIDAKTLQKAYRGLAPVLGLPYTGPKNLIEFGVTGDPYYLLGGRPQGEQKNPNSKAAVLSRARKGASR